MANRYHIQHFRQVLLDQNSRRRVDTHHFHHLGARNHVFRGRTFNRIRTRPLDNRAVAHEVELTNLRILNHSRRYQLKGPHHHRPPRHRDPQHQHRSYPLLHERNLRRFHHINSFSSTFSILSFHLNSGPYLNPYVGSKRNLTVSHISNTHAISNQRGHHCIRTIALNPHNPSTLNNNSKIRRNTIRIRRGHTM